MKKKVFILIIATIACLIFGCGETTMAQKQSNNFMERIGGDEFIREYVDTETGVHYLVVLRDGRGAICPRYNADGSLYVD